MCIRDSLWRDAMNCLLQILGLQLRRDSVRLRIGTRHQREHIPPIEPAQYLHLKGAHRAFIIEEDGMPVHWKNASSRARWTHSETWMPVLRCLLYTSPS